MKISYHDSITGEDRPCLPLFYDQTTESLLFFGNHVPFRLGYFFREDNVPDSSSIRNEFSDASHALTNPEFDIFLSGFVDAVKYYGSKSADPAYERGFLMGDLYRRKMNLKP